MIESLDKVIAVTFKLLKAVLVFLLVGMIAILVVHIWFRYVMNNSLTWSEELLKILLVWFGMLSVSVLAVRREHVAIVVFKEHMPENVGIFFSKLGQVITVVICLVMIYVGFRYTFASLHRLTPALRVSFAWAYAAIPVSFLLVTFYEFRNLLVDLTGKGKFAVVDKPDEDLLGGSGSIEI